ncbi:18523_t:CDS:1, partial [Dentiscutata erythropus]
CPIYNDHSTPRPATKKNKTTYTTSSIELTLPENISKVGQLDQLALADYGITSYQTNTTTNPISQTPEPTQIEIFPPSNVNKPISDAQLPSQSNWIPPNQDNPKLLAAPADDIISKDIHTC